MICEFCGHKMTRYYWHIPFAGWKKGSKFGEKMHYFLRKIRFIGWFRRTEQYQHKGKYGQYCYVKGCNCDLYYEQMAKWDREHPGVSR